MQTLLMLMTLATFDVYGEGYTVALSDDYVTCPYEQPLVAYRYEEGGYFVNVKGCYDIIDSNGTTYIAVTWEDEPTSTSFYPTKTIVLR